MDASHASLRDDFESSTPTIDALCDELRADPDVFGVRITGGGWGGSVVALTRPGALAGRGWMVRAVDGACAADGGRSREPDQLGLVSQTHHPPRVVALDGGAVEHADIPGRQRPRREAMGDDAEHDRDGDRVHR